MNVAAAIPARGGAARAVRTVVVRSNCTATSRGGGARACYSRLARPGIIASQLGRRDGRANVTCCVGGMPTLLYRQNRAVEGQRQASSEAGEALMRTPLHKLHLENGGKMVPFGGFEMPVQYGNMSIAESHMWTRQKASLFDVSHMVQHHITGPGAEGFLSKITPAAVSSLEKNHATLAVLLHPETGGIVDDTIVTRLGPEAFYVVTNAACRHKDIDYLERESAAYQRETSASGKPAEVKIDTKQNDGLIALQGPLAAEILQEFTGEGNDLSKLYFGQCTRGVFKSQNGGQTEFIISRGGYTGEDGFEMSVPGEFAAEFAQRLLQVGKPERIQLAGLGARDSLRIEAGMCLYGHDINDDTTPPEGGLAWVVAKERRADGGFHGADRIIGQLKKKGEEGKLPVRTRRVGFIVDGAPAREGATVLDVEGKEVGKITSGCPSPALGKNIAMGLVNKLMKEGTEVKVLVRNKPRKATVAKMPFVESKYYRG